MANSLSELRKQQSKLLDMIKEQSQQKSSSSSSSKDDRFWNATFDPEKGRGSAIIRFLPAPVGEDWPYVKVYSHGFQGPTGKWYIENSLSTLGKKDPCGNLNSRLWNSGIESDKDVARQQKRKTSYYANVYVVKDPANPDAEGKVFLYRFGQKIYDIIQEAMYPGDDDIDTKEALNPFDPWTGANFVIKLTGHMLGKKQIPIPDKSYFEAPTEFFGGDDEKIEEVWKKAYSLAEFHDPKNFKTEEELSRRLFEVLGPLSGSGIETVEGWGSAAKNQPEASAPSRKQEQPRNVVNEDAEVSDFAATQTDEDDELLNKLKSLL